MSPVIWCLVAIVVVLLLVFVWMYVSGRKHRRHQGVKPHRHIQTPPRQVPRNKVSHLAVEECRASPSADVFGGVDSFEGLKHEM